jgi:predicted GNAT family acetyltransferase
MALEFFADPRAFLAAAGPLLEAEPVLGTVIASVTSRIRDEQAVGVDSWAELFPGEAPPFAQWWVVARDGAGTPVGCGMRTAPFAPYPGFLMPMPDEDAVALARALHERGETMLGLNGALPSAETCAREIARLGGGTVEVVMHTRLFEATAIRRPTAVPGRLRTAVPADVGLALAWFEAFGREADEQAGREPGSHAEAAGTVATMLRRIEGGRIVLWEDETGEVAHLTGVNPPAFGVARIGPVYTPPAHRGRGFASAAVAAVSQRVLDGGSRVCLFTDQANPVSNRVYERIGYRPVVDMVNLEVRRPAGSPGPASG